MNVLMMLTWCTPKGKKDLEAGVFHYEQAQAMEKYANVAMYYPFDQEITEPVTKEIEWGILTYRSKFKSGKPWKNKVTIQQTFDQIVKEFKPDILHAHCATGAGHHAVALGKKYKIPVIITEHTPVELSGVNQLGLSYFLGKKAYTKSDANICVSSDLQRKLAQRYPKASFKVIHNGIFLPKIEMSEKKYYIEGYCNIVIVASLYDLEVKGMAYLLRGMKLLKDQGEKVILHHIGGGIYLEHFQNMAKELEIEDICIFHGKCNKSKMYEIVNEMDFLVSASLMESAGVSVQEAMLLGKPVLGTNSGGVESLVPKEAGRIVEKAKDSALAEGILQMKKDMASYDSEKIKKYALENFEIDTISKKYMALYSELSEKR